MVLDFIVLTLLFGIGILLVNISALVFQKGAQLKRIIILTVVELLLLGGFLYVALPSKNLSSLLWYNLWGAFVAVLAMLAVLALSTAGKKMKRVFTSRVTRQLVLL